MTIVTVNAGACGFSTRITAGKEASRHVRIHLESECEAVLKLAARLEELGSLGIRDIVSKGIGANRVFTAGADTLTHAACPVLVAIIKASEVELGWNVPVSVSITFDVDRYAVVK